MVLRVGLIDGVETGYLVPSVKGPKRDRTAQQHQKDKIELLLRFDGLLGGVLRLE